MLKSDRNIFSKELILIKQIDQKSVVFAVIDIFFDKSFRYGPYLCNGCHDLMQKAMNFNYIAVISVKGMIISFIFVV